MYYRPAWLIFTFVLWGELSIFEECAQSISWCHLSKMRKLLKFWLLWFYWQECRLSNDVTRAHEWMTSLCLPCLERTQIYIMQQYTSVMESSSTRLLGDDIERILEETSLDSESSLTQTMTQVQLKAWELTKQVTVRGNSTSPLQGKASDTSFMWEDMSKVKSISFV
jgi:hypothetical protein